MQLSVKTKVHRLSEEEEFKLIAIASPLNEYKISWLLNEEMGCKFQQSNDLTITDNKNNQTNKFGVFVYENESDSVFTLYLNRTGNDLLIKSIKSIDYIIKFQGQESDIKEFVSRLKKQKNILAVFEINQTTLKPKEMDLFA
jgi:hypothetical protein